VSNHFFIAGMPILAAFFALYLVCEWDCYRIVDATLAKAWAALPAQLFSPCAIRARP
jgi:hypothetical protein